MDTQLEPDNCTFVTHRIISAVFHICMAMAVLLTEDFYAKSGNILLQALFWVKSISHGFDLWINYYRNNGVYMTQALFNLVCTIVMWFFFKSLNFSGAASVAMLYATLMLIISLAISAIFSNTALKGYHVVVVCSFNGLNQVFRGLLLFIFFAKASGTLTLSWLAAISPLLAGLKITLILSVINLVFAYRNKNRNKSNSDF